MSIHDPSVVGEDDPTAAALDDPSAGTKVIRGSALRIVGFATMNALSLLSFGLVTRHLGVERFGDYQTAVSVVTIVSTATDAGMGVLALREYSVAAEFDRPGLMRQLLGLRTAMTVVGVVLALGAGVALDFDGALLLGTALAGVGVGLNVVQSMLLVPLQARLRLGAVTALQLLAHVAFVTALVVGVLSGSGVALLLAAFIPGGLVGVIATRLALRGEGGLRPAFDWAAWVRLARMAAPVALATAAGAIYLYVAQVVCDVVATDAESGLYAVGFRIFIVVAAMPGIVVATAFPVLARSAANDADRFAYASGRVFVGGLVVGGFIAVALAAAAPLAVGILADEEFAGAVGPLRLQAYALVATFVAAAASFSLLSLQRNREVLLANAVALAVTATLVALLAASDGAAGAALASLLGEVTLAVVSLGLLLRARPALWPGASPIARCAVALAAGTGAVIALRGASDLVQPVGAAAAYAVVALLVGAVPRELLDAVRARVRR